MFGLPKICYRKIYLQIQRFAQYFLIGMAIACTLYTATIPWQLRVARSQAPLPQAILVLGGGESRELAAAQLASQYPTLDIWISTGQPPQRITQIFKDAGAPLSRLHLDYQAVDTVTNFTTMVKTFQQKDIQHIYILTSDFHMRRAKAIAFWVFGSRGIAYSPLKVPSSRQPESTLRVVRDIARSWVWLATGHTGAYLGADIKTQLKTPS